MNDKGMDSINLNDNLTAIPAHKIWLNAIGLYGPSKKRATVYDIPGYTGPELAVVEYASPNKLYQPKAYTVYETATGKAVEDSSGVLPLSLILLNAVERMQSREKMLAKRRKVGTGSHAKYTKKSNRGGLGMLSLKAIRK